MPKVTVSSFIRRKRVVNVDLVEAEVSDVYFIMSRARAVVSVKFTTDKGKVGKVEHWMIKGDLLNQAMSAMNSGGSLRASLSNAMDGLVSRVENTTGLKDQLKDNGQLKVFSDARVSLEK